MYMSVCVLYLFLFCHAIQNEGSEVCFCRSHETHMNIHHIYVFVNELFCIHCELYTEVNFENMSLYFLCVVCVWIDNLVSSVEHFIYV